MANLDFDQAINQLLQSLRDLAPKLNSVVPISTHLTIKGSNVMKALYVPSSVVDPETDDLTTKPVFVTTNEDMLDVYSTEGRQLVFTLADFAEIFVELFLPSVIVYDPTLFDAIVVQVNALVTKDEVGVDGTK